MSHSSSTATGIGGGLATEQVRVTESGWWRSGVTVTPVDWGEERVMIGVVGVGGGEGGKVVGVCVGGVVGESHEMVNGRSPAHSRTSLMNSQAVSGLVNRNWMFR